MGDYISRQDAMELCDTTPLSEQSVMLDKISAEKKGRE